MENKTKKIIYLLTTLFVISLFFFIAVKINNKQANKGAHEQCGDKLERMSVDEITEFALRNFNVPSKYIMNDILSRHLFCKYINSENEQEKENILKNESLIIEQDSITRPKGPRYVSVAKENFKNPNGSFFRMIFAKDFDEFCPHSLPGMCQRENGVYLKESSDWCENVCTIFNRYRNDDDLFNQEVMRFSNLDESKMKDMTSYVWRIGLTLNLKGKEKAFELCDNISFVDNFDKVCRELIYRASIWSDDCLLASDLLAKEYCPVSN